MVRRTRAAMQETRALLLATARQMFSEQGFAHASMDDLTARAGLTRGALYHHFGDKKGLLAAVVAQLDAETDARLQARVLVGEARLARFSAIGLEGCDRFLRDVHHLWHAGLHTEGEFILGDAGGDATSPPQR